MLYITYKFAQQCSTGAGLPKNPDAKYWTKVENQHKISSVIECICDRYYLVILKKFENLIDAQIRTSSSALKEPKELRSDRAIEACLGVFHFLHIIYLFVNKHDIK